MPCSALVKQLCKQRGLFARSEAFHIFFSKNFPRFLPKKNAFQFKHTLFTTNRNIYIYFFRLLVPKRLKLSKGASKMGSSMKVADLNPARAPLQTAPAIEEKPCACTTWSSHFPTCFRGAG